MGSLLEELARREAAARKRIEEIREQIERLQGGLAAGEQVLSRLVVTRETVQEILDEAAIERPPADGDAGIAGGLGGAGEAEVLDVRLGCSQSNGTDELRARVAALYPGALPANVEGTSGSAEANFVACWRLVAPGAAASDPASFRDYVTGSGAEFTVAQESYTETRSGWLSDRTTRYLAAGRPALVQDTGQRSVPTGEGLLTFRTPHEARRGARALVGDYNRHCRAARALAHAYFDSDTVLGSLLEDVL